MGVFSSRAIRLFQKRTRKQVFRGEVSGWAADVLSTI